jgi:hypothetical protein
VVVLCDDGVRLLAQHCLETTNLETKNDRIGST